MIEMMKIDMGGCAAVLGCAKVLGQLQPKVILTIHCLLSINFYCLEFRSSLYFRCM